LNTTRASDTRPRSPACAVAALALRLSIIWAVLAVAPRSSRADLIYTWTSTNGSEPASGTLDVSQSALAAGSIGFSDVASFSRTYQGGAYSQLASIDFPFAIDAHGIPTEETKVLLSEDGTLVVPFNSTSFSADFPAGWTSSGNTGELNPRRRVVAGLLHRPHFPVDPRGFQSRSQLRAQEQMVDA
jgi:hypothetical protein